MERIYFLLHGDGPEKDAVEAYRAECEYVQAEWVKFREKYGNDDSRTFADRVCLGISFTDQMCSISEARKQAPEGWKSIPACQIVFRPLKNKCPEAYREWKALPMKPSISSIGASLGAEEVHIGNRVLFLSYEAVAGMLILSCPIASDGTYYVPKGPCGELTASRYIELTKKGD